MGLDLLNLMMHKLCRIRLINFVKFFAAFCMHLAHLTWNPH